jgi:hypothetical protein
MFCLITGVQRVTTSKWLLLLKLLSLFDNAPAVSSLCDHVPDMPPICPSAGYTYQTNWHPPQHPGLVLELRREDRLLLGMMRRLSHTQLPLAGMKLQILFHVGKHLHWSTVVKEQLTSFESTTTLC